MGVELNIDAEVVKRVRRLAAAGSDALAVTAALKEWLEVRDGAKEQRLPTRQEILRGLNDPAAHRMSKEEFERLSADLRTRTRLVPQTPSEILLAEARLEK